MNKKNKLAVLGVFTALALIFSYVESLIPVTFGIPGMKLGLANLLVVILLYRQGWKEAVMLSLTRIILSGFLFGNLFGILYSLAGAAFSLPVMWTVKATGLFSPAGVSISGGASHNVGQLTAAMFLVGTWKIWYYLPLLLIFGTAAGALMGILACEVMKRTEGIFLSE